MAQVVFMRGVNVGGRKAFKPAALARSLAEFDTVNVGAAGTFVVRKAVSQARLRAEILRRIPFDAEMMICRGRDLEDLASRKPFRASKADERPFVSVMARRPRAIPRLPLSQPAGKDWQVKIIEVSTKFALSLHRHVGRTLVYPNEVVEKKLGVAATTRNWNTVRSITDILGR